MFRWYRHSYYVLDPRVCVLTAGEIERWGAAAAPSLLVHVPRTSGSTLRAIYATMLRHADLGPSRHYTAAQLHSCDAEAFGARPAVAVVRDPWARAVSSWRHLRRVAANSEHSSDRYFGAWLGRFESFAAFAETGGLAVAAKMCPHFFPALDYLIDPRTGAVLVDEIHAFEELHRRSSPPDSRMANLLRATHLDVVAAARGEMPRFTDAANATGAPDPTRHCAEYTEAAARIVGEIYADDARAFGYAMTCAAFLPPVARDRAALALRGDDAPVARARRIAAEGILAERRRASDALKSRAAATEAAPPQVVKGAAFRVALAEGGTHVRI